MRTIGLWRELPLHLMILPGFALLLIFSDLPMAGIMIAIQMFIPAKWLFGDRKWIGLSNFDAGINIRKHVQPVKRLRRGSRWMPTSRSKGSGAQRWMCARTYWT